MASDSLFQANKSHSDHLNVNLTSALH